MRPFRGLGLCNPLARPAQDAARSLPLRGVSHRRVELPPHAVACDGRFDALDGGAHPCDEGLLPLLVERLLALLAQRELGVDGPPEVLLHHDQGFGGGAPRAERVAEPLERSHAQLVAVDEQSAWRAGAAHERRQRVQQRIARLVSGDVERA